MIYSYYDIFMLLKTQPPSAGIIRFK